MSIFNARTFIIAAALFTIVFCTSCQGGGLHPVRQPAAATSEQDVIDAWNVFCHTYSFEAMQGTTEVLVGSLYHGGDFPADSDRLMLRMQLELDSAQRPDISEDELLSAVFEDPAWYE